MGTDWSGPPRGIVEAMAARPGIQFLYWSNAQGDVDLTATHLTTVRLDGTQLHSVRLPDTVRQLALGRDVLPDSPGGLVHSGLTVPG